MAIEDKRRAMSKYEISRDTNETMSNFLVGEMSSSPFERSKLLSRAESRIGLVKKKDMIGQLRVSSLDGVIETSGDIVNTYNDPVEESRLHHDKKRLKKGCLKKEVTCEDMNEWKVKRVMSPGDTMTDSNGDSLCMRHASNGKSAFLEQGERRRGCLKNGSINEFTRGELLECGSSLTDNKMCHNVAENDSTKEKRTVSWADIATTNNDHDNSNMKTKKDMNEREQKPGITWAQVDLITNNPDSQQEIFQKLHDIIFGKRLSMLLIFIPLGILSHLRNWDTLFQFWFNFLALIPFATILGDFTEEVALHANQVISGLINATFGNAVIIIVAIQALRADQYRVVQMCLLGSLFSNLLLILGGSLFFGGIYHNEQNFNAKAAALDVSLLALASLAFVLPTPYAAYYDVDDKHVLLISRVTSLFLVAMYVQTLIFQLITHSHLFENHETIERNQFSSVWMPLAGLLACVSVISVSSGWIVGCIDGYESKCFVGLVLLPLLGNAGGYVVAIDVAIKDKVNLSLAIIMGGSIQIVLLILPGIVLVGWAVDKNVTLNFQDFEIIAFLLCVVVVSTVLRNAKSNWLHGSLLLTAYCLISLGFLFENTRRT